MTVCSGVVNKWWYHPGEVIPALPLADSAQQRRVRGHGRQLPGERGRVPRTAHDRDGARGFLQRSTEDPAHVRFTLLLVVPLIVRNNRSISAQYAHRVRQRCER
jgi:hypothetical protein